MLNSFLRQTRIFTPEEATEIMFVIVLCSYIDFDLCINYCYNYWFIHE